MEETKLEMKKEVLQPSHWNRKDHKNYYEKIHANKLKKSQWKG